MVADRVRQGPRGSLHVPAEALMREARRQRKLPLVAVPRACVLDPDRDVVRHPKRTGSGRAQGWACYHTEPDRSRSLQFRQSNSAPQLGRQACWFKPTRPRVAAAHLVSVAFHHRQCCLPNRCKLVSLGAFSLLRSADLTLVAGDFVLGFQDCPEHAAPSWVLVQTNTGDEEGRFNHDRGATEENR